MQQAGGVGLTRAQTPSILLVLEDRLVLVSAVHDVTNRYGILDTQLARHGKGIANAPRVSIVGGTRSETPPTSAWPH
jgi:hypothetical protein